MKISRVNEIIENIRAGQVLFDAAPIEEEYEAFVALLRVDEGVWERYYEAIADSYKRTERL